MSQSSKPLIPRLRCLATLLQQLNAQTACDAVKEAIESIESTEALRQSQSLPAGAVAGLVGKWRENADALRSNQPVSDWQRAEELENAADELEQSLQADAREKGEAVDRAALLRVAAELDNQPIFSSQLERARWYVNLSDRITAALATQPAQASEKDEAVFHLRSYGDVSKAELERHIAPKLDAGKINGYLFRERCIEIIMDGEIPHWMSNKPGIRVTVSPEENGNG